MRAEVPVLTLACAPERMHTDTRACALTRTSTHAYTHARTRAYTHARARADTHARTRAYTGARARVRAQGSAALLRQPCYGPNGGRCRGCLCRHPGVAA
eukprot:9948195-Alexandrium_andersonii.AAC.1